MSSINSLSSVSSLLFKPLSYVKHLVGNVKAAKILKVTLVAASSFAVLQMLSSIPTADAGFVCFTLCMSACTGATGGAFVPACVAACVAACSTNPV